MEEILEKIGFDWHVALANLVNFLIILFVLKKFAWGPIGKMIAERKKKIEDGLENAKVAQADLLNANIKKEEIIKEAKDSAKVVVARSQADGKEIIKEAEQKATLEKEEILKQAKIDAEREKKNADEMVRKDAAMLVSEGVKKVISGYVEAGKGEDIINAMLSKKA